MSETVFAACLNCGATNRFPLGIQGKTVVCGRCKHPLHEPGRVLEPLPGQAHTLFQKSRNPVLAEFYSQNCAHCAGMEPIVEGLAERRKGEVVVIKVSLDHRPELGAAFGIMGVPTFLVIHKGAERGRISGAIGEADFALWLANLT
jgi:thiol-disulfide isomerase/thioredoxin